MPPPSPPAIEPSDPDDVLWALETAHAVWGRGDVREALQWVRRAAESAAEAGADARSLDLAKQAAELRTLLDVPPTIPPPALEVPVSVPSSPAPQAPATGRRRVRNHAVRVAVCLSFEHDGALVAVPIAEGQTAPPGSHEALLVAVDPSVDLFVFPPVE